MKATKDPSVKDLKVGRCQGTRQLHLVFGVVIVSSRCESFLGPPGAGVGLVGPSRVVLQHLALTRVTVSRTNISLRSGAGVLETRRNRDLVPEVRLVSNPRCIASRNQKSQCVCPAFKKKWKPASSRKHSREIRTGTSTDITTSSWSR